MEILELNLPSWAIPFKPYYVKESNLVLYSSNFELPKSDSVQSKHAMKAIFYGEKINIDNVKSLLDSLIIYMNLLNENSMLYEWKMTHSYAKLNEKIRNIEYLENLESYIKETSMEPISIGNIIVDFNHFPLGQFRINPVTINFNNYFQKFVRLSVSDKDQRKLKKLIEFFALNSSSFFSRVYNNSNFKISNSFAIIEALINIEIKDQSGVRKCKECGYEEPSKKRMNDLITEFVETSEIVKKDKYLIIEILKKHYNIRNNFFHNAKFETWSNQLDKMVEKLDRTSFTLEDEIEHASGCFTGLFSVNNLIRFKLLELLDSYNKTYNE